MEFVDLQSKLAQGCIPQIDIDKKILTYKRDATIPIDTHTDNDDEENFVELYNSFIKILNSMNRNNDFITLMKCIVSGTLPKENIALHVLLDVANFCGVMVLVE